jgi:hypothetical protein
MRALRGLVLAQVAWLGVFILGGLHTVHAQTFQHVLLSKAQLDDMKIMLNAHMELILISFCAYQLHSKLASCRFGNERF